jgi:hypothetical protein
MTQEDDREFPRRGDRHRRSARQSWRRGQRSGDQRGDGAGEHPTQAPLDLYTIKREKGGQQGHGGTGQGSKHGDRPLLARCWRTSGQAVLRGPGDAFDAPEITPTRGRGTEVIETTDWPMRWRTATLYVTRVQKERFTDEAAYLRVKNVYVVDLGTVKAAAGVTTCTRCRGWTRSRRRSTRTTARLLPPGGERSLGAHGTARAAVGRCSAIDPCPASLKPRFAPARRRGPSSATRLGAWVAT